MEGIFSHVSLTIPLETGLMGLRTRTTHKYTLRKMGKMCSMYQILVKTLLDFGKRDFARVPGLLHWSVHFMSSRKHRRKLTSGHNRKKTKLQKGGTEK